MSRVVHFEFFGEAPGEMAEFYRQVFGWEVQTWPGPFEYWLATTGPEGEPGINGAIAAPGGAGAQRVVNTMDVLDLEATTAAVIAAGGSTITETAPIPGVGWFRYVADPSGLVIGVLQADEQAGVPS